MIFQNLKLGAQQELLWIFFNSDSVKVVHTVSNISIYTHPHHNWSLSAK